MTTDSKKWIAILPISALDDEEAQCVDVEGNKIAIYKTDGCYYATDDRCPHGNASLSEGWLEDGKIECPLHQSEFDLKTGKVLSPPCKVDVPVYPVEVRDDTLFIGMNT